jgi:anti-sigma factor RsiW
MNQTHPTPEELVEYLHGELPASHDAWIHSHLAACSSCAEAFEAEASLTELLRAHARSEDRDFPPQVAAAIREAIERPRRPPLWESLRTALRPVVALPAAAAIVVALYLGINAWHRTPAAMSINAAYYVNNHAALTASAPFAEDAPIPAMLTSDDTAADQQTVAR